MESSASWRLKSQKKLKDQYGEWKLIAEEKQASRLDKATWGKLRGNRACYNLGCAEQRSYWRKEKGRTECYAEWTRGANLGSLRIGTTRNSDKEARIKARMKGYHKKQAKRMKNAGKKLKS